MERNVDEARNILLGVVMSCSRGSVHHVRYAWGIDRNITIGGRIIRKNTCFSRAWSAIFPPSRSITDMDAAQSAGFIVVGESICRGRSDSTKVLYSVCMIP